MRCLPLCDLLPPAPAVNSVNEACADLGSQGSALRCRLCFSPGKEVSAKKKLAKPQAAVPAESHVVNASARSCTHFAPQVRTRAWW